MILHFKVVFKIKKIIILPLLLTLVLCSCSHSATLTPDESISEIASADKTNYVRDVWFTYYELSAMIKDKSEEEFSSSIDAAFKRVSDMGFNTVTVQVRPYADAFYRSSYFPTSEYAVKKQGDSLSYDPLLIMCETANKYDLQIEAWVNPYRVSVKKDINTLSNKSVAFKWYKNKDKKSNVYLCSSGIYFNPASDDVTNLIADGVREIVENYDVSAVHFDDYFYPSTDKKIDETEYKSYLKNGGKSSLADFRRDKVSDMVKTVYSTVKSADSKVRFGISPAADIKNDRNALYADVQKWASEEGYCDYICPQVYFGFRNVYQPFMFTVKKWISFTNIDLYVGLPLYKSGKPDKYAAQEDKSIINEFVNNDNIISRQITYLSKLDEVKGFYIFSYSSLSDAKCKAEVENMLKVMK